MKQPSRWRCIWQGGMPSSGKSTIGRMLAEKLITGKEYRDFEQEMLRRYQPFSGDLYT